MWGLSFLVEIMAREKLLEKWVQCKHCLMNNWTSSDIEGSMFSPYAWRQLIEAFCLCESIAKQGMLHSRGELLLMLDADGATKVNDLEKLENQVCIIIKCEFAFYRDVNKLLQIIWCYAYQIQTFARKECQYGDSAASNSSFRISDIPLAAFGSRAHLEEKALASVRSC